MIVRKILPIYFFFSYEKEYVYGLINDGRDDDAEFLGLVFRYIIYELITMNDIGFLDRVYKDIYHSEMVLNKTYSKLIITNSNIYSSFYHLIYKLHIR